MHNRGGVIIIEQGKVALMKRVKTHRTYYTFPGGKQELGETIEQTAIREAFEELGVTVSLQKPPLTVPFNGVQYYFYATITGGVFGAGNGEEFQIASERGTYEAVWIPIDQLHMLDIFPLEVVTAIQHRS